MTDRDVYFLNQWLFFGWKGVGHTWLEDFRKTGWCVLPISSSKVWSRP